MLYRGKPNLITNGSSSIALYHIYYYPVLAPGQYFSKMGTILPSNRNDPVIKFACMQNMYYCALNHELLCFYIQTCTTKRELLCLTQLKGSGLICRAICKSFLIITCLLLLLLVYSCYYTLLVYLLFDMSTTKQKTSSVWSYYSEECGTPFAQCSQCSTKIKRVERRGPKI